jgi:hypothetical protein
MATQSTTMNPFFEVERTPIFTKIGNKEIRLAKEALINVETGLPVGLVGKDYKVIPNIEVSNCFNDAFSNYTVSQTMDFMNRGGETWFVESPLLLLMNYL